MKTIAMRFADNIAPEGGTIVEHEKIIEEYGYVWYGKFGLRVSDRIRSVLMDNEDRRVLLIHSGTINRYWFYIEDISYEMPSLEAVPKYYQDKASSIKTWFKVMRIEKAEKSVMSKCTVVSSGNTLSMASRHSMSPYFFIEYNEGT